MAGLWLETASVRPDHGDTDVYKEEEDRGVTVIGGRIDKSRGFEHQRLRMADKATVKVRVGRE